jgi:hypothetical protein
MPQFLSQIPFLHGFRLGYINPYQNSYQNTRSNYYSNTTNGTTALVVIGFFIIVIGGVGLLAYSEHRKKEKEEKGI